MKIERWTQGEWQDNETEGAQAASIAELEAERNAYKAMCEELNKQLNLMLQFTPAWADVLLKNNQAALAKYKAMKQGGV
jgi:hypothetical protein